jgi:hypothetical protein
MDKTQTLFLGRDASSSAATSETECAAAYWAVLVFAGSWSTTVEDVVE